MHEMRGRRRGQREESEDVGGREKSARSERGSSRRVGSVGEEGEGGMRRAARMDAAVDMRQRYVGHCNTGTDIKQASFLGERGEGRSSCEKPPT